MDILGGILLEIPSSEHIPVYMYNVLSFFSMMSFCLYTARSFKNFAIFKPHAFIVLRSINSSTLVLGINHLVIMTHPVHPIRVHCSSFYFYI